MKRIKKISFVLILLILFFVIFYNISFYSQNQLYQKYGVEYNSKRKALDLKEISSNWKSTRYSWDKWKRLGLSYSFSNFPEKYYSIFSLKTIPIGIEYENSTNNKQSIFFNKFIHFDSNLLFWKNKITQEIDFYSVEIDSITTESLILTYYHIDENGNTNYYEANHYLSIKDQFICGTPYITARGKQKVSGKPFYGNITKKQCDSILNKWNLK